MGYLILTRRPDESLVLTIDPAADRQELLRQLEQDGLDIRLVAIRPQQVKIGIRAPDGVYIDRAELVAS